MAGTHRVNKPAVRSSISGRHSTHHHGSHRRLLEDLPGSRSPADVDAIIVPTARNVAMLRPAVELAGKLSCTLVVLCSKWSSARDVAALVAGKGVKLIAIDADGLPAGVVPAFETDRVLKGSRFERRTDTSLKRNFGLLLARLIGWQRIVFLDDDIAIPEPADLEDATGLTGRYDGVGLVIDEVNGMPDNSVVCHAFRAAGGAQDMFIGGGALAVGTTAMTSFFPNIYNEDWFFLLDDDGLRPTTTTGRAIQKKYDPFLEDRAKMEELGDCLAEGLFWLLDNGHTLRDATTAHWETFLRNRAGFITDVIGMVERSGGDPERRHRMLLALKAARGRCQYIKPELCVRYVDAWRADRAHWRGHVDYVHRVVVTRKKMSKPERRSLAGVRGMFRSLGVPDHVVHLHLPNERFDHDLTDFDLAFAGAVGQ
jgi:glycosyltransferase involved in cell wall biosynthesis